jgi:hypothetical protein
MTTEGAQRYRVTVRGQFDRLTDEQRERLLADADAHDTVTGPYKRLSAVAAAVPEPRRRK